MMVRGIQFSRSCRPWLRIGTAGGSENPGLEEGEGRGLFSARTSKDSGVKTRILGWYKKGIRGKKSDGRISSHRRPGFRTGMGSRQHFRFKCTLSPRLQAAEHRPREAEKET